MSQGTTVSSALQQTTHALYGDVAISHRQPAQRCCETGRPIATDPVTGSIVCSCQIQPGSQSYLSRVPRLPEHIYGPTHSQVPAGPSGIGQSAFYSMDGVVDRRSDAYAVPLAGHAPYFYDQIMAAQQYGAIPQGFDFNAARRKNATRETTGPLKAWLNGHRKNPYPTKGEKVMLAIITRMTLTQVSTWFANARRRLKKENVFGDDDFDSDDKSSKDDSVSSQTSLTEDDKRPASSDTSGISDISDIDIEIDDVTSRRKPSKKCVQRLFSPDIRSDIALDRIPSPEVITNVPTDAMKRLNSPLHTIDNSVKSETLPPLESFAIFKDKLYQSQLDDGQLKYDHSVEFKVQKERGKRKLDETDIAPTNAAKKPKIWSISEIIG